MAATVQVIVATTVMLFFCVGSTANSGNNDVLKCTNSQTTTASVTTPRSTIKLQCPDTGYAVKPDCTGGVKKVFCSSACSDQKALSDLCPGATGTQDTSGNKPVTLVFPQLPKTPTTLYLKCFKDDSNWCLFAVNVGAAPAGGPQVCAVQNSSVTLSLKGNGGTAQFACGDGMELYPKSPSKVYKEDCVKEKDLKDLTRVGDNADYFTLQAIKTPKDEKLCYVCAKGEGKGMTADTCAVLISVSASAGLSGRSALGLAVLCVLALLHAT